MLIEKLARVLSCEPDVFTECDTPEQIMSVYQQACYLMSVQGNHRALPRFLDSLWNQGPLTREEERLYLHDIVPGAPARISGQRIYWPLIGLLYGANAVTRMQEQVGPEGTWIDWWRNRPTWDKEIDQIMTLLKCGIITKEEAQGMMMGVRRHANG